MTAMVNVLLSLLISTVVSTYTTVNNSYKNVLGESTHTQNSEDNHESNNSGSGENHEGDSGRNKTPRPSAALNFSNKHSNDDNENESTGSGKRFGFLDSRLRKDGEGRETTETEDHFKDKNLLVHPGLKLGELKLQSCEARQASITNRSANLLKFVTNMEAVFDKIATKVEAFYVSSGKIVPNYDALVADIATKKAMVDTDLATAQTDASTFNCTATDPKGILDLFRKDMQTVKTDLHNYRTSIKNLIVAIHPENDESSESTGDH